MRYLIVALCAAYGALAVLANWLAAKYVVTVPLTDLVAPAGVFCIGAVLVVRDWIQQAAGTLLSVAIIPLAALASYLVAVEAGWTTLQRVALASAAAFLLSETLEALVFSPWRRRSPTAGVLLSGAAGTLLDSFVFLTLAFHSLAFFGGQVVGKGEMLLVGVVLTALRRRAAPVPAAA